MGAICYNPNNSTHVIYHQKNIGMAWLPFVLEIVFIFAIVALLLNKYMPVQKKTIPYYLGIFLGWFLALYVIILMPIDISMAWYDRCICNQVQEGLLNPEELCAHLLPYNYIDSESLVIIWKVSYWVTFFCTWLIYPLAMSYSDSAEFTVLGKLKSALIANAIFYGIGGVACVVFFLVIFFTTAQKEFSRAIGVGMVLTNSWGLFLVVCFVGVGVINVPRDLWRKSYVEGTLRKNQWKVGLYHDKYKTTYEELVTTMKIVRKLDTDIRMTDRYRDFVDAIVYDCPPEYQIIMRGEGEIRYDRKGLVELHYRLIQAKHNYKCASTEFHKAVEKTLQMEDVTKSKTSIIKGQISWTIPKYSRIRRIPVIGSIYNFGEWLYYIYLKKWIWKVLSIMAYIATVILLWSEVTMFAAFLNSNQFPSLSIYYLLIWKIKSNTPFGIQTIAFMAIIYNVWCTYNSLLKLKLFNWYELKKYKLSNLYSMLFSAAYLCRISIPVVLNMIYLVGFDNTGSAFIRVMGPMSVVPFFGGKFNIIFPALIIIVAGLTVFNCWRSVLSCFKVKQFKFDEFFTDDELDKGKQIMNKERDALIQGKSIEYFGTSLNRTDGGISTRSDASFTRNMPLDNVVIEDIIGTAPKKENQGFFSFFKKKEEEKESIKLSDQMPSQYYNSPKFQLSSSSSSSDDESFMYNKL